MLKRLFSSVSSIKLYSEKSAKPQKSEIKPDYSLPRPHAIKMNETVSEVITYKIPNRPLTPLYEVPLEARVQLFPYFEPPADSKLLEVAVIGAPNSGKSSLINSILGSRFLSVSRKVNTTHKIQHAVLTQDNTQLVFVDTPGVISTHSSFTNKIATKGWEILPETDMALFVVDGAKILQNDVKAACSRLQELLAERGKNSLPEARIAGETQVQYEQRRKLAPITIPAYLVVNKVDLVTDRRKIKYLVNELKEYAKFSGEFFVSANTKYNIQSLTDFLKNQAKPGKWSKHPHQKTTLTDLEIATELVREQVLHHIHDELPYRWIYRVVGWTPFLNGTLRIDIDILVKTKIHIGILIGRESRVIKKIIHVCESWLSNYYQRKVVVYITGKIMDDDVRKATYKGNFVQMAPPHSLEQETIESEQIERLKLID